MEDGQTFKVPLEEMERVGDAKRPTRISQEVYEKYAHADPFAIFDVVEMEPTTPYFKGEDALVQPQVHSTRDGDSRSSRKADSGDITESRNDRSSRRDRDNQSRPAKEDTHRKPRRRRRSSNSGEELTQSDTAKTAATKGGATQPGKKAQASVSSQSATQAHRKPRRRNDGRNDGRTDNRIDNQLGESRTDGRAAIIVNRVAVQDKSLPAFAMHPIKEIRNNVLRIRATPVLEMLLRTHTVRQARWHIANHVVAAKR